MSWLNLNQSLNSIKGQITNFATEVLSEGSVQDPIDGASNIDPLLKELEEKCRSQELEIATLKQQYDEIHATLQAERISRRNGLKSEDATWYWDPPARAAKSAPLENDQSYQSQLQMLQDELSTLRDRDTIDLRPDDDMELIRLREENKNLTTSLDSLDNQHQEAMDKLLALKKELQKNFEVLKQEHEDLKAANEEYMNQISHLQATIAERDREIMNFKSERSDFDTLHHKYQNLERIHSLLRENAEKFQEENQDLHEEIFKLQEQVTKLEHEVEIANTPADTEIKIPKTKYEELIKENEELKKSRYMDRVHSDEVNIDDNAKSVIENLKREIVQLKLMLEDKEVDLDNTIKLDKVTQLYNKYVNFELPLDYVGEIPSSGDSTVLFRLEAIFKTVNSFKKDIDRLEHLLSEKNHSLNHMQTQIDDLTTENDFLTTDIQQFESELNEMKKNNDFLLNEITTLKNASKLQPIIETHEDNYNKLETELADCTRINKSFESEIERVIKKLDEVNNEKLSLQDSLNDLKQKYTSMLDELEVCKHKTQEVADIESMANSDMAGKLKDTNSTIDDLKKQLNAANVKNEQLCIDIHILQNDKVLLSKEIDDLMHSLSEKCEHNKDPWSDKIEKINKQKAEIELEKSKLLEQLSVQANVICNPEYEKLLADKNQTLHDLNNKITENSTLLETIEALNKEVSQLKSRRAELTKELELHKNSSQNNIDEMSHLNHTINDLKEKLLDQNELRSQITKLNEENKLLTDKKIQLENELSYTESKITHVEEEFDKLVTDLNEKDGVIENLNTTITDNNNNIINLNQQIVELKITVDNKNEEIERLRLSLNEASDKLLNNAEKSNTTAEALQRLKEESQKHIDLLNEEINMKNTQISALTNQLTETDTSVVTLKAAIELKDKEIKELNQSIVEITDKIKVTDNGTDNNAHAKLLEEKETLTNELLDLKNNLSMEEQRYVELKNLSDQLRKVCEEHNSIIETLNKEKADLIALVNLKHNESLQYHSEIQRLHQVLVEQSNDFKQILEEKSARINEISDVCTHCENLRVTLKEKDEIIKALTVNSSEYGELKKELGDAVDVKKTLTEKCENLEKSLASQTEALKKCMAENVQLLEKEQNSTRELDRLRRHLVEMEENYTQELMTAEQKLTEVQARMVQVEDRAKQTSTVYTSNSIRANQEVETLRNQLKLVEKQRADLQAKLSEADDARVRGDAASANLQLVLEQFQLDKERDIQAATEKIRRTLDEAKERNKNLENDIAELKSKLDDALAGLQAASRLGDQLETKSAQINDLKEQVRTLQMTAASSEERYHNAISNQQDRVDKNLVKNLVINYILTASNSSLNKTQVLRILSTVLDFNQQECEKLGLARSQAQGDSLAAEFVKFLQNESKPRPPLPAMSSRSTTPTSRRSSTLGPAPFEVGHSRNASTGSNNLLFQSIDTETTTPSGDGNPRVLTTLDTGVNQTRDTGGAILKHVLRDT